MRNNQIGIIVSRAERLNKVKQAIWELQMMNLGDYLRVIYKFLVAYSTDSSYRGALYQLARAFMKRPHG